LIKKEWEPSRGLSKNARLISEGVCCRHGDDGYYPKHRKTPFIKDGEDVNDTKMNPLNFGR